MKEALSGLKPLTWIEAKGSLIKLWLYLSNRRSHLASGICAYPAGDYEADPEQV
jgi:hypothetical protein